MSKKIKILLGVTGGIAAYKSAEIARLLIKKNYLVKVVMTRTAEDFITPLTFETLTNEKVYPYNAVEKDSPMLHIDLARWADIILIAPTTAEFLSKILHGRADDMLSTICLAYDKKLVLAPSMNKNMWANKATQENYKILKKRDKIYVLISDGECQEGTTWETLLFAAKHKLENLIILIDYNKIQALSKLNDALPLHNLVKKIQSFNINCVDVKNGHNFSSILKSFKLKNKKKLPTAIIFNTIKGKGVKEFENDPVWHARKLSKEELVIAKKRLGF